MADVVQVLLARAKELVDRREAECDALRQEQLEIQRRAEQIELKFQSADVERLDDYQPKLGFQYQCPECFIKNETQSTFGCVPGTNTHDVFKCPTCSVEISIGLR